MKIIEKLRSDIGCAVLVIICSIIQYEMLQYSGTYLGAVVKHFFSLYSILGIITLITFNLLFVLLTKSNRKGVILNTIIVLIFAVTNHLVYKFHGVPFSISELRNFGTALNVLSPSIILSMILQTKWILMAFALIVIILICKFIFSSKKLENNVAKIYLKIFAFFFVICILFHGFVVKRNIIGWSWVNAINKYGYLNCFIQNGLISLNPIEMPKNYNKNEIVDFIDSSGLLNKSGDVNFNSGENRYPDIIIILNESFYDFNQLVNISGDLYWLNNFYNTKNSIFGYAVCPLINGGTNDSEYEILTSNAKCMINGTPFNTLNLENANSAARYLTSLGYKTYAMHPADELNYYRGVGYPSIGFENSCFEDDFKNIENYGKRKTTDESVYENLLNWYLSESGDNRPCFMYCLTYQNHSDYEKNDESYDIVHTINDFGDKTDDIDEYLTSIYLSDVALKNLLEELNNSHRDVVVAMCGDHKPPLDIESKYNGDEYELRSRSTPFIIWSNEERNLQDVLGENKIISMIYFIPTILETFDVPLSRIL